MPSSGILYIGRTADRDSDDLTVTVTIYGQSMYDNCPYYKIWQDIPAFRVDL